MDDAFLWVAAGIFAVVVIPAFVVALNDRFRRRRERALGRRRKRKTRL